MLIAYANLILIGAGRRGAATWLSFLWRIFFGFCFVTVFQAFRFFVFRVIRIARWAITWRRWRWWTATTTAAAVRRRCWTGRWWTITRWARWTETGKQSKQSKMFQNISCLPFNSFVIILHTFVCVFVWGVFRHFSYLLFVCFVPATHVLSVKVLLFASRSMVSSNRFQNHCLCCSHPTEFPCSDQSTNKWHSFSLVQQQEYCVVF